MMDILSRPFRPMLDVRQTGPTPVVIELRWVRDYVDGGYPFDQPIDAYAGPVLIGSLVEDGLEATLKRRGASGKPTFVRGILEHRGGRTKADWSVVLPRIPEPADE
jgi:hypothetical protein